MRFTGRVDAPPADVLHEEILRPQFEKEARTLLPWYVLIEKVLLLEYRRMGLIDDTQSAALVSRLNELTPEQITADPEGNMSDLAFAIERYVQGGPEPVPAAWHVDRSRNDLQACAQLLYGRSQLAALIESLVGLARAAADRAAAGVDLPMPGYTHLQAAQVVTPGFYLAALVEESLRTIRQMRATYDAVDECPLGAGAMAGQQLDWDLPRMATLLGFDRPTRHALMAVASRGWALRVGGDLSAYGVVLSRFATDLMAWASGAYRLVDLPDSMVGISSSMPQKRNFPVLERIRGRSAHLTALHLDVAMVQRATPYANMVEVSKEAGSHLNALFAQAGSVFRLTSTVLAELRFRPEQMRDACAGDHLGGFRLANLLTLRAGLPWRHAQVVAGRYIAAAVDAGRSPGEPDGPLLRRLAAGYPVTEPTDLLTEAFDVDADLASRTSDGSTGPDAVRRLLAVQCAELDEHAAWGRHRRSATTSAVNAVEDQLRGHHVV
ncbi:lyase family protein [Micromonospora sp. WMMD714]|uniref:argininosuccinate lyase n=1 Tax=Micromonospora sp. WMMD714 TaxID=3016097 RepID=UPI00249CEB40|nr:lyase family protein [Micromonospora sp. WMMD714]WFE66775.1 lyase family protein [Micromonospora sp. WMMD714]